MYECNIGYFLELEDQKNRTCQRGGMWSGENLTCLAISTTTVAGIHTHMHVHR